MTESVDLNQQMFRMMWRAYHRQRRVKKAALTGIPLRRPGRPRKVKEQDNVTVAYTEVLTGQEGASA